jgi:glycine/D-amino acid oxidase-like deaminating enzyme
MGVSVSSWLTKLFCFQDDDSMPITRSTANAPNPTKTRCWGDEDGDATVAAVVVVGGGVIGLCTAYNLAKAVGSKQKLKITVLDARSSAFTAASQHNTGCLHYGFHDSFGKDITPLGKYSFELWQSIARSDIQFVADTGYRPQSFFPIIPGDGKDEKTLPNWVSSKEDWDVDWGTKGVVCATV